MRPKRQRPRPSQNKQPGGTFQEEVFNDIPEDDLGFFSDVNFPDISTFGGYLLTRSDHILTELIGQVWAGIQRKSGRRGTPMRSPGTTRENLRGPASTEVNVLDDLPANPADVRAPSASGTTRTLTRISSTEARRAPRTSPCLRAAVTPRTTTSRTTPSPSHSHSPADPTAPGPATPARR